MVDLLLKVGASADWISPTGQLAHKILANGYALMVDLNANPVDRPIMVCHYLNKKGVRTYFPMQIDEYLVFSVDREKANYACSALKWVGITVDNPPPSNSRRKKQPATNKGMAFA